VLGASKGQGTEAPPTFDPGRHRPYYCTSVLRSPLVVFVLLASAAVNFAQRPLPAQSPAAPARSAAPTPDLQEHVKLQFPNSDVQDVLRYYEQLTGKRVIMDNFVNGKVNIFLTKDPTREEAIQIIQISLLMNGFSLVPEEPDIIKVIGTGKNPRTQGVPIISDQADIPPGDQVVSFLFRLRYADPTELQQVIGQYLSPPSSYTSVLPLPKSSSILITENSTVIRGLAKIIEQIDVAPAEVTSEFIKLERADASKVVDMLKDIFEKNADQTAQPGMPGPRGGGVRGVRGIANPVVPNPQGETDLGALTALSEDSVIVGKIKLAPDVRTNRIHVITRPINMPFIRKLIAEFDANVEFAKPVTRALRYISASDVLPVLVQALTEPGQEQQAGAGGTAGPQAGPTPQRTPNPTVTNPYNAGQGSTATGSELNISEELSTQPVDTAPKAVTIGNAKIIADQRANTIIVLGNREVVVKVQKILDEMDVKAPQVALSTVIGELQLNNDEEFGVDYFVRAGRKYALTTNFTGVTPFPGGQTSSPAPSPGGSPILSGGSVFDPGNLITFTQLATNAAKGANVYLAAGSTLAEVVHALDSTGKFKTISRPTVFTSNNKKAIIANGQEIPVPVSTLSNAAAVGTVASVQSSIEFKKVALQLEVVPLINSEKEVSLDILQKIDSVVPNSNVNIGGNSVPTIATRYIRTNVSAPNCSTIVLGGLISEMRNTSKNGFPYLSRLPLVGSLFRGTVKNRDRMELLVLMRPEVSLTKLDLYRLRQKTEDRDHFGPELEQEDCPDCPKKGDGKQLPPPDIPTAKDIGMR
jgi:general secretion pathway protein D